MNQKCYHTEKLKLNRNQELEIEAWKSSQNNTAFDEITIKVNHNEFLESSFDLALDQAEDLCRILQRSINQLKQREYR